VNFDGKSPRIFRPTDHPRGNRLCIRHRKAVQHGRAVVW